MCLPLVYGRVHIVWLALSRGRPQDLCRKLLSQIAAEVPGAAAFQLLLSLLLTSKVATHPFAYARRLSGRVLKWPGARWRREQRRVLEQEASMALVEYEDEHRVIWSVVSSMLSRSCVTFALSRSITGPPRDLA